MTNALLVAAHDVRDRSRLFLIAAVLACTPFVAPLLPTTKGDASEVIAVLGGFIAVVFGAALAVGLGVSAIGRELADGRLSFWYSKPISSTALWTGKAAAAMFIAFTCTAIIAMPALLVTRGTWRETWSAQPGNAVVVFAGLVGLFLVSHAAATMVRSRSMLLAVDLVAGAAALAGMTLILRWLLFTDLFVPFLLALGGGIGAVLAVAPVWQLARGRTDVRRSHAALSLAVWSGVALVLILGGAVVLWFSSAPVSAIDRISLLDQSPSGNAFIVSGSAPLRRGIDATYIVDAQGRSERIRFNQFAPAAFSHDGAHAAWTAPRLFAVDTAELMLHDVALGRTTATGVVVAPGANFVFSDDGSRLAVRTGATLMVLDRASGAIVASHRVERRGRYAFFFVDADVLRIIRDERTGAGGPPIEIAEWNLRTNELAVTGRADSRNPGARLAAVSRDGSRMLLRDDARIVDGRSGGAIAEIAMTAGDAMRAGMLRDGRVVVPVRSGRRSIVRIYSRDGLLEREVALPVGVARVTGERTDGSVILLGHDTPRADPTGRGRTMFLLDVSRGAIVRSVEEVKGPNAFHSSDPRLPLYDAGAKLAAAGPDGKLVFWN